MKYDGRNTNSGLYLFNPLSEATIFEDLRIFKQIIESGPIMDCIETFLISERHGDVLFSY